jgi:uncharacterized membrane protein YqjE
MELTPPQGIQTPALPFLESIRNLVAFFVRYLELRLALFGLECREAGYHLLVLALLLVTILICFAGFIVLLVVFLLYLLMLILHWEWGWSALALAGLLLVMSLGSAVFFRSRIAEPFFPTTMAEFKKDREWLKHQTKSSS